MSASARRGRRYPQGAHAVAVYASLRMRCVPWRLQAPRRAPDTEQSAGTVLCPGALHRLGVASQTRCAHFVRYAQTGAASQFWMRAARADSKAALRAATEIAPCGYRLSRCHSRGLRCEHHVRFATPLTPARTCKGARLPRPLGFSSQRTERLERGGGHPVGAISGATSSTGLGSARASALPHLTRRVCLSRVSAANAASSAARPQAEQRSGVAAKRRPPQHEPPPGAPCRAAPSVARKADVQRAAKGRARTHPPRATRHDS